MFVILFFTRWVAGSALSPTALRMGKRKSPAMEFPEHSPSPQLLPSVMPYVIFIASLFLVSLFHGNHVFIPLTFLMVILPNSFGKNQCKTRQSFNPLSFQSQGLLSSNNLILSWLCPRNPHVLQNFPKTPIFFVLFHDHHRPTLKPLVSPCFHPTPLS